MNKINVLDKGFIELLEVMGSDTTIAESARISYLGKSSGEESDDRLIQKLIANEHKSPFEQAELRFLVKAPIFVARQWMRHRTWSYSEVSRRYTDADIDFYLPLLGLPEQRDVYSNAIKIAYNSYRHLLDSGVRKEAARGVLPVCMYTTFYAKTDLNNLLHFLELRRAPDAQREIRECAICIEEILKEKFPITYRVWNYYLTK